MRLGVLFSGGKDSTYAAFLTQKHGHELTCLISLRSKNPDSYMFHTPSISAVEVQAEAMGIPIILQETEGEKEAELDDLRVAITNAKDEHHIEGIVTGTVASVYQAARIQKICNELELHVFNPLWLKDQIGLLEELVANDFHVIITSVAAEPLDGSWLGQKIDNMFIEKMEQLQESHRLNPAGEGGEFESLVLNCPLFKNGLAIKEQQSSSSGNAGRLEVVLR